MPRFQSSPRPGLIPIRAGFTIIELLMVVAIIAVLVGLLVPAARRMITESSRGKAASQAIAVANAINAFRAENSRWPGQTANTTADAKLDNDIVLADLTNNPRGRVYLDLQPGWLKDGDTLIDPWQRDLQIALDLTGDGKVSAVDISPSGSAYPTTVVSKTVLVWSWGPDPDRNDKWVLSWQR